MKPVRLTRSTIVIISLLSLPVKAGTTYYVNNCGHDANCNGQYAACWSEGVSDCAKKTIQAGMNLGGDGDTILVAPGEYTGLGNRDLQFPRTAGIARAITVRCSGCAGDCVINSQGSVPCQVISPSQHRGFWFDKDGATNSSVVEGFTIKNGCIATAPLNSDPFGGAIFVDQAQPTIRRCVFEQNAAVHGAGVAFAGDSGTLFEPVLEDCTIRDNYSLPGGDGGGVACLEHVDALVRNCWIHGNTTAQYGGGMFWERGSDPRIEGCVIENNITSHGGGGLYIDLKEEPNVEIQPAPRIVRSRIGPNNSTNGNGGGIEVHGVWGSQAKIWIENCTIIGNNAYGINSFGGGLALTGPVPTFPASQKTVIIVNCVIAGNSANSGGGVYVKHRTSTTLNNVTMMHNKAVGADGGSAIFFDAIGPLTSSVDNTILWYDAQAPAQAQVRIGASAAGLLTVRYSDIQDALPEGVGSESNILLNPLFVDPDGADNNPATLLDNNYHLASGSPCNDRGSVLLVPPDELDLDGNGNPSQPIERVPFDREDRDRYENDPNAPNDGVNEPPTYPDYVDIGAYEYGGCPAGTMEGEYPFSGTIDARQPHPPTDNSLDARQGIGSPNTYTCGLEPILITLSVRGAGIVDCWNLCETGIEEVEGIPPLNANRITSVTEQTPGVYRIFLERPISAGHWTTISYLGASAYVSYASLPGDYNGSGKVNVTDLGGLRGYILTGGGAPPAHGIYSWDLDHNGLAQQGDIDRWYDLAYGVSTFIPWHGVMLPDPTNICPAGGEGFAAPGGGDSDDLSLVEDFVEFFTSYVPAKDETPEALRKFVDTVAELAIMHLTESELKELAGRLDNPALDFASEAMRASALEIVAVLRR